MPLKRIHQSLFHYPELRISGSNQNSNNDIRLAVEEVSNKPRGKSILDIADLFTAMSPLYYLVKTFASYHNCQIDEYEINRTIVSELLDSHEEMMQYCYQLEQDGYLTRQDINQALFRSHGISLNMIEKVNWHEKIEGLTHFMRNRSNIISARKSIRDHLFLNVFPYTETAGLTITPYDLWISISRLSSEERSYLNENISIAELGIMKKTIIWYILKWLKQPAITLTYMPNLKTIHTDISYFNRLPSNIKKIIYDDLPDKDLRSVFSTCKSLFFEGRKNKIWYDRLISIGADHGTHRIRKGYPFVESTLSLAYLKKNEDGKPAITNWHAVYKAYNLLPSDSYREEIQMYWQLVCLSGNIEAFESLRRKEMLISRFNDSLPIHYAAIGGHIAFLRVLVDAHKFDIKQKNISGACVLHLAALGGHTNLLKVLVNEYWDIFWALERDNMHLNTLDYALMGENNLETITFLREAGLTTNRNPSPAP